MKLPCPTEEQDILFEAFEDLWERYPLEDKGKKNLDQLTEDFIIDKIKEALIEHNYNQTHTSKFLGIKRTTLIAKLKKFNLLR